MLHPSIFVVPKAGMVIKDSEQGQNYHTYTLGTTKCKVPSTTPTSSFIQIALYRYILALGPYDWDHLSCVQW